MKAVSLHQPWATAIALGSKRIETRSWPTAHRGPLAIHAAKRMKLREMQDFQRSQIWQAALSEASGDEISFLWHYLPFGEIVATCELVACWPSDWFAADDLDRVHRADIGGWTERQMGDFGPGRFGWVLENIKPLAKPVPFRGMQGLFTVPDELALQC